MANLTVLSFNADPSVLTLARQNVMATTASAIILVSIFFVITTLIKPIAQLPGPWYTKWTSLPLKYHWVKGNRTRYVHDLHKRYGRIVRVSPNELSLLDIPAVKTVYSVKETFRKTKWYKDLAQATDNMFNTTDVTYHRKSRRLLAASMADSAILKLAPRVGGHIAYAMEKMKTENETRKTIDIYKWWLFMTTDIIVEFTYGESFHMLDGGVKNEYSFFLENAGMFSIYRALAPFLFSIVSILPLKLFKDMKRSVIAMLKASGEGIKIHEKIVEEAKNSGDTDADGVERTLFTNLFKAQKDGSYASRDTLLSEGQLYIVAGSDTTANTLTYFVWALCRHPHIKAPLLAALQELPEDYTDEDLRKVDLLNRCIKEALRLYPATPEGLPRLVPAEGVELCGHLIDAGTVVAAPAYSMHRDPAVFPHPDVFDPDRWIEPSTDMLYSSMAFGRGARTCLGLHLAYTELRMGVAAFFRTFPNARVSTREGMSDLDMEETSYFILSPKGHRCLIDVD